MSLYTVLADWVKVVDPSDVSDLASADQRELCADIVTEEPDHLYDSLVETFSRDPSLRVRLIEEFRHGDFLQMGAVIDKAIRQYLIGSEWLERELQDVKEKEGRWSESY